MTSNSRLLYAFATGCLLVGCRFDYETLGGIGVNVGVGGTSNNGTGATSGGSPNGTDGGGGGSAASSSASGATSSGGIGPADGGNANSGSGGAGADGSGNSANSGGGSSSGGVASGGANSGGAAAGGTAGGGGAASGGAPSGGTGSGAGGSGGSGGVSADYVVNTGVDEDDGGAATGTGLSLREAINQANATPGVQTISMEEGVDVIVLLGNLPNITEGLQILGAGNRIDASNQGDTQATFYVAADNVVLEGLSIENSPSYPALFNSGANARVENCTFINSDLPLLFRGESASVVGNLFRNGIGDCLSMQGLSPIIRENRVFDCGGNGIFLGRQADGAVAVGNLIVRSLTGFAFGGLSGADLWFNTVVGSASDGVLVGQAGSVDFENNIVIGSASSGVSGSNNKFSAFSYNLLWGNTGGACSGCTLDGTFVTQDPILANPAGSTESDFLLQMASPAIDAGADVGEDRTFGVSPNYFGAAADIGFSESNY